MKHLIELLENLKSREFKITSAKNGEQLQQTQRNALKAELLTAIRADIGEVYEFVYQSKEGILLEIANDSVANALDSESEGSGAITVCLDLKIKNLDCNATDESEDYERELAEKAEKKKADEEKKAAKIARDKASRTKKGE